VKKQISDVDDEMKKSLDKFRRAIIRQRYILGLSQLDIAERMDCNLNTYGRIERGQVNPSLTMVIRMASALETSINELIE